jgi:hypothetical protein
MTGMERSSTTRSNLICLAISMHWIPNGLVFDSKFPQRHPCFFSSHYWLIEGTLREAKQD